MKAPDPIEYAQKWLDAHPAYEPEPAPAYNARWQRRRAESDTLTALLSCKPLDVEMSRLQRAALRRLKNKGKR
jgi:hypothetical protein